MYAATVAPAAGPPPPPPRVSQLVATPEGSLLAKMYATTVAPAAELPPPPPRMSQLVPTPEDSLALKLLELPGRMKPGQSLIEDTEQLPEQHTATEGGGRRRDGSKADTTTPLMLVVLAARCFAPFFFLGLLGGLAYHLLQQTRRFLLGWVQCKSRDEDPSAEVL